MHDIKVAGGQFEAAAGDKPANVDRMAAYAGEAKAAGCELIVFPELILTGYLPVSDIVPLVEPVDGPNVQAVAAAARDAGIGIVFGFAELDPSSGVRHNSLAFVDASGVVKGVYRKIQLWGAEQEWAEPGDGVVVTEMAGVQVTGWICFDSRFPEIARMAALKGAEVALVATAWLGPGDEWHLAVRSRALDNAMFVAGADIVNPSADLRCRGLSVIASPRGHVLAAAEEGSEGIIHAELSEAEMVAQRGRLQLLEQRKVEIYERP